MAMSCRVRFSHRLFTTTSEPVQLVRLYRLCLLRITIVHECFTS